jgi:peroxin-12
MFRLNFSLQVGLPYLRAKAQDYYESVGGGVDPELLDDFQRERYLAAPQVRGAWPCAVRFSIGLQTRRERFRRLFRSLYPWCNTAFELWLLAYNVAYLFDKSPFYRPWLAWMGLDIRRARVVIEVCFFTAIFSPEGLTSHCPRLRNRHWIPLRASKNV